MNEKQLDSKNNKSESLHHFGSTTLELVSDFQTIVNLVCKSLNSTIALIAYRNVDSISIYSNELSLNEKPINVEDTIFEQSLLSATVNLKDVFISEIKKEAKNYISNSLTSKSGEIIGFLAIINQNNREFTSDQLSLLKDFAIMTAQTIEKHHAAHQLQEVFTDFVHKTVHDLKNPFTTISLTTELLKRKADDAKLVASFSQRLDNANNKVFKNLERLKLAFPLTSQNFKLNLQEINIVELFTEVQQLTKREVTIDNQLTEKIYGDHYRLTEAIIQLINHLLVILGNLEKLTFRTYAEENQAIIAISNAGYKEKLNGVEDFVYSTGLAIAKKLIQMHYGHIKVIKQEASYYSCYISLPLSGA